MICYHGSDTIVDNPKILNPNRPLDLGGGFYVTSNKEQAVNWAIKVAYRNNTKNICVNKYEFDFEKANEKWLDFICNNRQGKCLINYDIVIGPVADDKVYRVVVQYENKDIDKEAALKKLKTEKLCNQILFHTDKALQYLKYIDTEVNNG